MTRKFSILCLALLITIATCLDAPSTAQSFNPYQVVNPDWHTSAAPISQALPRVDRKLNYQNGMMNAMFGFPYYGNDSNLKETRPINDNDTKDDRSENESNSANNFANAAMPMAAMMAAPMMAGSMMAMHNPIINPFHPAHYVATANLHNPNSLTRMDDEDLGFDGYKGNDNDEDFINSLSRSAFPELRVRHQCESIQRQALQVANNLIKRQNKVMFKEIMNYLLKSKFLIGLTEIKLTKVLKQKFLGVIKKFTDLTEDNVRLIHSADDELLDDDMGMGDEEADETDDSIFNENKPKVEPTPLPPRPEEKGPEEKDPEETKKEEEPWWDFFRGRKIRKNK
jgi:hypothetical protein